MCLITREYGRYWLHGQQDESFETEVESGDESGDESDSSESESEILDGGDDVRVYSSVNDSTYESSGNDEESDVDFTPPTRPLIAKPPEVLEPCHYIVKQPGPTRECFGFRICGDNIDKIYEVR